MHKQYKIEMDRYRQAKIYKIWNLIDNQIYIGSTCKRMLAERMANHRANCRAGKPFKIYNHMREIGIDNFFIELIEVYPCASRDELTKREGYWIQQLQPTLNTNVAGRSIQELYQAKREEKLEYQRQYSIIHKEEIHAKKSVNTTCICGGKYTYRNKSRHLKCERHQFYLQMDGLNMVSI